MTVLHKTTNLMLSAALVVAVFSFTGYSSIATGQDAQLTLSGAQEVPAVSTSASGASTISVSPDKSVSGSVTTSGMAGTMAHIHTAAAGQNGPVIIPLTKSGENTWSVPPGTKLTDAQYDSFKAGNLYVNVHSAAHPGGEVRAQLKMTDMGMVQRGTGVSMTNPVGVDGKPITTFNQPTVDRPTGTSLTVPLGVDGKPLGQTTSFGQR
jgi:CHRD domain